MTMLMTPEQTKRIERAKAEAADYTLWWSRDHKAIYVEHNHAVYTVSRDGAGNLCCDCKDAERHPELLCKHRLAACSHDVTINELPPAPPPAAATLTAPERQRRMDRLDFVSGR